MRLQLQLTKKDMTNNPFNTSPISMKFELRRLQVTVIESAILSILESLLNCEDREDQS